MLWGHLRRTLRAEETLGMYRYLFYRLFAWIRSWQSDEGEPEWGAASGITCLLILNAVTTAIAADLIEDLSLSVEALAVFAACAGVAAQAINYNLFIRGGRGEAIVKEFEHEAPEDMRGKEFFAWFYPLASVGAFVGILLIA